MSEKKAGADPLVVLCRHAATEANREGRFLSREDASLSDDGRRQCEELVPALRAIDLHDCWSSPMRRCLETVQLAAPHLRCEIRDELREIDFGAWEGMTIEALQSRDPGAVARRRRDPVRFRPPGGESFEDVARRLETLAGELRAMRAPVLVVSHRGTLGVLERLLRDLPLQSREVVPLDPAELRIVRPATFRST